MVGKEKEQSNVGLSDDEEEEEEEEERRRRKRTYLFRNLPVIVGVVGAKESLYQDEGTEEKRIRRQKHAEFVHRQ